jgi:hypothetical protein
VDYSPFLRKLPRPPGFHAPTELVHDDLVARAITRADLDDDVRGINASLELIRRTRGGAWPDGPVTAEGNFADLVWHEVEWRDGVSFTYVVRYTDGTYVGCAYLYPMGRRTPLSAELLEHDVDVSWWVTPEAHARGDYAKLHCALQGWLAGRFPFTAPYYSNRHVPGGGRLSPPGTAPSGT